MKKFFIGVYNPSIILTYISVFCSIIGIACATKPFNPTYTFDYMSLAISLLIIAGICDMFDGTIARKCKRTETEKKFGIQLDSLADTVSFVIFPICILLAQTENSIISLLIACFYAFAGIMRLGWFNVTTEENNGYFQGMPVTMSAFLVPIFYLFLNRFNIASSIRNPIMQILFLIIVILFISNFKIKKPNTKMRIFIALFCIILFVISIPIF